MAAQQEGQFLRIERRPGGYALVVLCREPVNTMNLAYWRQLTETLDELEGDPEVRRHGALRQGLAGCARLIVWCTAAREGTRAGRTRPSPPRPASPCLLPAALSPRQPAPKRRACPLPFCSTVPACTPQVRGIIFCSGLRRDVFTAGNDINELYAPLTSRERYR